MNLDPAQLSALAAILRLGSFEAAAHALNVTQPAISQRIRSLEEQIGSPVVTRTSPPEATAVGARLARHAEHLSLLEAELARDIDGASVQGRVRIALNADSLDTWFLPAIVEAGLLVDLVVDDQAHSLDLLRRGEAVAAITDKARPAQGCVVYPLGSLRYFATASPDFAARWFPEGPTADAFEKAPMLQFSAKDRIQHEWLSALLGRAIMPPSHILPSTRGFVDACALGLGWGLNPLPLIQDSLATGDHVKLSDQPLDTPLYWQVSRLVDGSLKTLTKALKQAARASLVPASEHA